MGDVCVPLQTGEAEMYCLHATLITGHEETTGCNCGQTGPYSMILHTRTCLQWQGVLVIFRPVTCL